MARGRNGVKLPHEYCFTYLETQNREHDDGCEDGSERVDDGHEDSVAPAVVVAPVVAGHGNQGAEPDAQGVEHLRGGVQPDLRVQQRLKLKIETDDINPFTPKFKKCTLLAL